MKHTNAPANGTQFWSISQRLSRQDTDKRPVYPWLGYVDRSNGLVVLVRDDVRTTDPGGCSQLTQGEYFATKQEALSAYLKALERYRQELSCEIEIVDEEIALCKPEL